MDTILGKKSRNFETMMTTCPMIPPTLEIQREEEEDYHL
jgi:hypothetical protein